MIIKFNELRLAGGRDQAKEPINERNSWQKIPRITWHGTPDRQDSCIV